jgi:extracellular factor (EF) 3-hydroxypalmitic acid methyl ester biosynthesis protein
VSYLAEVEDRAVGAEAPSARDLLLAAVEEFSELAGADLSTSERLHDVAMAVHGICRACAAAEHEQLPRETIMALGQGARAIHRRSLFIERLQTWPRGYQGDFETVDYLMQQQVRAPEGTIEYWLEYLALSSPIAQQHRNKMLVQGREIMTALSSCAADARILVLAPGSCPDLVGIEDWLVERRVQVVLCDGDAEALACARDRLSRLGDRLTCVHGSVLASHAKLAPFGPFDVIAAGGLFDYLPERQATFLLRVIWERLLAPGGRLFFTNIARGNPFRLWIEYMADWRLIERSEDEMLALLAAGCGENTAPSLRRDGSGLAWLLSVTRDDRRDSASRAGHDAATRSLPRSPTRTS